MTRSRLTALMLGLMMTLMAQPASAEPKLEDYMSTPFWLEGRTVPLVMLVLERDWKMFYPAYNNLADLDGDGALDIGFNPAVTYVGYFDVNSCYSYTRQAGTHNGKAETGKFVRSGPTTPQTQDQADKKAKDSNIHKTNLATPASVHGVCGGGSNRNQGLGEWHGNWLNYAMTSRMDAIRRVLYGGKRSTDTATQTILEMVRVPANANVWGGELYADDLWEEYAPSSPWYDISSYTGFDKPTTGAMHFWARADYYWTTLFYGSNPTPTTTSSQQSSATRNSLPLFRVAPNVPAKNRHPFLKVPLRIWDWTGDHSSYNGLPADGHLANSKDPDSGNTSNNFMPDNRTNGAVAWHFAARVEACQKGNISTSEGCRAYGENYKPVGLLQEYGEADRMFFGLLTGTINHPSPYEDSTGTRYRGGVVRHHISDFDDFVNRSDGTVVRPGLIDTIDAFEITGIGSARSYVDGSQAGNPLGEMVWEALRYLGGAGTAPDAGHSAYAAAGGLSATTEYFPSSEVQLRKHDSFTNTFNLPKLNSWSGRPKLTGTADDCPKPIILAISEVIPDRDGDNYPNLNTFASAPRSDFANGTDSKVPATAGLVMDEYLSVITEIDDLQTTASNKSLFFYPDSRGLCTARELPIGIQQVSGHCPSEPSLAGTYNLAAVAYYAHTHEFPSLSGNADKTSNVDFYAVGIPGNFPDISLTVSKDRQISLMPIAAAAPVLGGPNYATEGKTGDGFRTLLNFFIEYWLTDDGHSYTDDKGVVHNIKVPYRVKFRTNFEYTTNPCFAKGGNSNNWERDLFNSITITLLTKKDTDFNYRTREPLYINSGPYKTMNRTAYLKDRDDFRAAGGLTNDKLNPDNYFKSQTYYYGFRRPLGEPMDLNTFNIVGLTIHSDSVGSGYGASGQTGYTISGVTFPGAYLDVGLNRSDYPIYYSVGTGGSNCRPDKNTFRPNTACGDESVPLDPSGPGLPGARWDYTVNGNHNNGSVPSGFNNHASGSSVYTNNADCGYYHPPTMYDDALTPAECPYAGFLDNPGLLSGDSDLNAAYPGVAGRRDVCGPAAAGYTGTTTSPGTYPSSNSQEATLFRTSKMRYVQVRSFKFDTSAQKAARSLPNPMWLAAKYGGFRDSDNNGVPDRDGEWMRSGSGVGAKDPYNYFGVANMSELPTQLGNAFETIATSVATGTANASSINTVLGGGLSLQTQYRTEYEDYERVKIKWAGSVYAFFVDKWGNLRADTDGDMKLTLATSPPDPGAPGADPVYQEVWANRFRPAAPPAWSEMGDKIVHTVSTNEGLGMPQIFLCRDMYGNNNFDTPLPTNVAYNDANKDKYPKHVDCKPVDTFEDADPVWNSAERLSIMGHAARRVYTFFGKKKADGSESWAGGQPITNFEFSDFEPNLTSLHELMGQTDKTVTGELINYIRGQEFTHYRNRTVRLPWAPKTDPPAPWIMGDVINSKPIIVGDAASNFHLYYGSPSYVDYKSNYGAYAPNAGTARRRQVAYFGSNDGTLHAVNLGFFGSLADGLAGYEALPRPGGPTPYGAYSSLVPGDELWAYVPTAVLPHLQWLADPNYPHGFFVDLEPYATDITDASGKWRTIMIVGLRLGGRTVEVVNADEQPPYSYSEYFAMDVTQPDDGPPKLLWRFSHPHLGLSTASPTIVRSGDDWYAVLPSGPTSDIQTGAQPVPDPTNGPQAYEGRSTQNARVFIVNVRTGALAGDPQSSPGLVASEANSFFNDTFTPRAGYIEPGSGGESWSHHVVYMGLTARDAAGRDTGAVYRLQMMASNGDPLAVGSWTLKRLYNPDKPVTGAVNSAFDSLGNLWVVFGTGRVWSVNDLAPCGSEHEATPNASCCDNHNHYLYGIKEPLNSLGYMTFAEVVDNSKIIDVSKVDVFDDGYLEPEPVGLNTFKSYENLYRAMINPISPTLLGYKRLLDSRRVIPGMAPRTLTQFEMITTQPKIDGLANGRSNVVVTSYETSANVCEPAGKSYLNVLDTYTGLPAPYMGSYGGFEEGRTMTVGSDGVRNQVTGVRRAGDGMASEAWILKSGSQTIYGNTSFNSNRNMIYVPQGQGMGNEIVSWREVLDMNFKLREADGALSDDLN